MTNNPYLPPTSIVREIVLSGSPPPRPYAVVVTLFFGWVFIAFASIAIALTTRHILTHPLPPPHLSPVETGWRAALLLGIAFMIVGLHRRRWFGRWLGGFFILSLLAILDSAGLSGSDYANGFERAGAIMAMCLISVPFVWWFYALTLSRKARAWFNWSPAPEAPR